ncbi:MAG TPA: hypothetical protein VLN74_14495, partial [Ilumatobacteraceae bacterium]|nr:hypothetical protein [Ilumatobacteraceae bacterium]
IESNERAVGRALAIHTEIRRAGTFDLTTLSVALRQLRNLSITAVAGPSAPAEAPGETPAEAPAEAGVDDR